MDDYEFIFDYNTLIRKYINNTIAEATCNIISEDCVELRFKENADCHKEGWDCHFEQGAHAVHFINILVDYIMSTKNNTNDNPSPPSYSPQTHAQGLGMTTDSGTRFGP